MAELLSLRKYADSRKARGLPGGTLHAVQRAIEAKRITPIDGKIDPEVADIQWERKTDAAQQGRGINGGHAPREQPTGGVNARDSGRNAPSGQGGDRAGYFDVKQRRELAEAELAELDLAERRGELCDLEDAKRAQFEMGGKVRDRIMVVPDRVVPRLAACNGDSAKMHEILTEDLRNALREVASEPLVPTQN